MAECCCNSASFDRQQADHHRNTRFDNTSLLSSDIAQRWPENFSVIEADISDDRNHRLQNIGGVETSAQAHFDYRYLNLPTSKMFEGKRRD